MFEIAIPKALNFQIRDDTTGCFIFCGFSGVGSGILLVGNELSGVAGKVVNRGGGGGEGGDGPPETGFVASSYCTARSFTLCTERLMPCLGQGHKFLGRLNAEQRPYYTRRK